MLLKHGFWNLDEDQKALQLLQVTSVLFYLHKSLFLFYNSLLTIPCGFSNLIMQPQLVLFTGLLLFTKELIFNSKLSAFSSLLLPFLIIQLSGDFGEEKVPLVQSVAALPFPKAVILGNHDAWYTQDLFRCVFKTLVWFTRLLLCALIY